jgi:protein-tyrosine phosphatase
MTPFHLHSHLDRRLIGSEAPRSRAQVAQSGTSALVTLTESFREFGLPDVNQHHVPIRGCPALGNVVQVVGIVTDALNQGGAVWVHCTPGIDSTGVMVAAVLVRYGMDVEGALAEVEATFPAHRQRAEYVDLWEPYRRVAREYARMLGGSPR